MELFSIVLGMILLNMVRSLFLSKQDFMVLSCGIVGFSGKKHCNTDKIALLMLHNSLKRGEDNTGIYSLETGVIKTDKKAEVFLAEHKLPKTNMLIAHVRKSSVGGKLAVCSHPYEEENIVLAHNGTLQKYYQLATDNKIPHPDYHTDSHLLAILLDKDSKSDPVVYSTLSNYEGAAALLFTDKRNPGVLYAYRNSERPLFFGYISGNMYISSMEENLKVIGCVDIKEFISNYLHTIKEGVITQSMYYKLKEESFKKSVITNVNYKQLSHDEQYEAYAKNFKDVDKLENDQLVDKWVQASMDVKCSYMGLDVKMSKNHWYYVEDSSTDNRFDIQVMDDENKMVWVAKYYINAANHDYPSGYAVATQKIFKYSVTGSIGEMIFNEGSIIALAPGAKVSKDLTIPCIYGKNEVIYIDIKCVRPALREESKAFLESQINKINEDFKTERESFLPVRTNLTGEEETLDEMLRKHRETYTDNDDNNNCGSEDGCVYHAPAAKDTEENQEEEDYDNETVAVSHYILDMLDLIADDLDELTRPLDYKELKEKVADLKTMINESYDTKLVRKTIQEG